MENLNAVFINEGLPQRERLIKLNQIDKLSKTELEFLEQIADYLDKNGEITNYRAQLLTNKSDVSVKKYFAKLVESGILKVEGKNKG